MPYINIKITREGTNCRAERQNSSKEPRNSSTRVLDKNPKTTVVTIEEVDTDSWGIGGDPVEIAREKGEAQDAKIARLEADKEEQEKEANLFAGMVLTPSMAIHYSRLRNADDLAYAFQISYDAASCALSKYYRWYNHVLAYKMSPLDKRMYRHFYNQDKKCFVWNRHECSSCHKALYNCTCQLCLPVRIRHR